MTGFHTPTVSIPEGQWLSNNQFIESSCQHYRTFSFDNHFKQEGASGYVTHIPVSAQCVAQVISGELQSAYHEKILAEGWVGFQFALDGGHVSVVDGLGQMNHSGPRFSMCANSHATRVAKFFAPNCKLTYVSIVARPQFLQDQFGVETHLLPETVRAMLAGERGDFFSRTQPLTAAMINAASALTASNYDGKLEQTYARVKVMELLCYAVEALTVPIGNGNRELRLRDRDVALLHCVRDELTCNFASPPSLTEMSRTIGLNRNKLTCGFKELFGTGVYEYCQQLRMRHARDLLREDRLSIARIAAEVGFQNQSSFSRAYKGFYGVAPSQDQPS
jgi:AraC-like DNA-binding protein